MRPPHLLFVFIISFKIPNLIPHFLICWNPVLQFRIFAQRDVVSSGVNNDVNGVANRTRYSYIGWSQTRRKGL